MPNNIKLNKDSIVYTNSSENGLLLDGKTWRINTDGTTNLILSDYIPNTGNTENTTDFILSRKSMLFRGGTFAFGLPNDNPYITFNPSSFNLSSQGEVNISSTGQTTINGGFSLNLVGSSNIQIGNTLNNPTQYIKLSGGKFEVKTSSGLLYSNDHFTYDGTYGNRKLQLNITDTFAYSDTTNNTINYAFNINSNGLIFNSSQYNLQLTPVSFVVETLNYPKASINISSSVFTVQSHNSATNYGTLYFSNNGFQAYYGKEVNNDVVLDYKLDVNSSALVYTGEGYLNINSSGFNIDNMITAFEGDVIIDIPTDKKAYYVHNNSEPTDDDEIATKGDIVAPDMSNYVLKTDFNDLLEKYNDLCERLNQFLITTGEIEPDLPTLTDKFITVPTDNVSFSFDYIDGSYTIDWGDGVVETITTADTISHNYSESKVWEITLGPTNDESYGSLETYDFDENTGTNSNQFTEVNLNKLEYPLNFYAHYEEEANNETITTYRINYPTYYQGCGLAELLINCTALTNIYFGRLTEGISDGPIIGCDNLTTIYLDIDPEIFYIARFLAYDDFTEVYCYSETPFDLQWEEVEGEPPVQSYFRYKEWQAAEDGDPIDVSDLTIYVPANAVETYKTANGWSLYADCIQAI